MADAKPLEFSAIAESVIDGQLHISPPIGFTDASGVGLIADVVGEQGQPRSLRVRASTSPKAGVGQFAMSCPQPVTFKVFCEGEPLQLVELTNPLHGIALDLYSTTPKA